MKFHKLFPIAAITIMAASGITACHDDKGNYDYIDINKIEIKSSNGTSGYDEDEYSINAGGNLTIDHEVFFNGKKVTNESESPLSFYWTIYSVATSSYSDTSVDTIATTRVLNETINKAPGNYFVQLTVVDNASGVESYYRCKCLVSSNLSDGLMVFYECADQPGYSDAGIIANTLTRNGIFEGSDTWGLYKATNEQHIEGLPVNIFHEFAPLQYSGTPRLITDKDIAIVNPNDFSRIYTWDELFYTPIEKGNIQYMGPATLSMYYAEIMIMDNKVYPYDGSDQMSQNGKFTLTLNSDTDLGELAPWASSRNYWHIKSVIYSQTLGKFLYTMNNSRNIGTFMPQAETAAFDVNNTGGAKMILNDFNNEHDFFLFAIGDNRYIAEANFYGQYAAINVTENPNIGERWVDVSSAPDIKNATSFAVNTTGYYAYYGAGNKVYKVLYDENNTNVAWTAPDQNEVVTSVCTQKFHTPDGAQLIKNIGNLVHIATWNEQTKQGKLYMYMITPSSGEILMDEDHFEYTVPGKVKKMVPKFNMG